MRPAELPFALVIALLAVLIGRDLSTLLVRTAAPPVAPASAPESLSTAESAPETGPALAGEVPSDPPVPDTPATAASDITGTLAPTAPAVTILPPSSTWTADPIAESGTSVTWLP